MKKKKPNQNKKTKTKNQTNKPKRGHRTQGEGGMSRERGGRREGERERGRRGWLGWEIETD